MKKITLSLLLLFFISSVKGQLFCGFTYQGNPGTTAVIFYPDSTFSPNQYHFVWDFGDGTIDSSYIPTHVYNVPFPVYACCTIYNASNAVVCSSCDSVRFSTPPPNCNFSYSSQTGSTTFSFYSNISGSNFISWDFGDGSSITGTNQTTHTYTSTGTYQVCVLSIDFLGDTCSYCDYVTVSNTQSNCLFSFAPDLLLANTYNFYGQPGSPQSNISWNFGDGTTGNGINVSHTFNSSGLFLVCMTESDSLNNVLCSSCYPVNVNSSVNCNFTSAVNPQNNLLVNFASNGGAPPLSVTWDFGDSTTGTGANPAHTYSTAGTYLVCVTIGSAGSVVCSSCNWVTVGNNSGPCSIYSFPDSAQQFSYYFNLNSSNPSSTVVWDFGDNSTGIGSFVNHVYNAPGPYTVCSIERDSMQNIVCQSCISIFVGGGPVVCQASFLSTSLGLTGYFIDLSVGNLNATSYSWDFGDGSTSTVRFPQHTYAAPGTYTVCQTISSGNCTDQFCSPIIVDSIINPAGGCQAFFAIVQLAPFQVSVVNLSSGLNLGFSWDYGDGSTDSLPFPSHYYSATGSYNLCLTVYDANGCSSTYCDTINVDALGYVYRGMAGFSLNVFSPIQITAGVNEIKSKQSFKSYPNPVTSDLHIVTSSLSDRITSFRILSLLGSEILSGKLSNTEGSVNLQKLATGSYLLEVSFSDGSRSYQSIIKN